MTLEIRHALSNRACSRFANERRTRAKKKNEFPPATNFLQLNFPETAAAWNWKRMEKKFLPSLFLSFFSHDEHITLMQIVRFRVRLILLAAFGKKTRRIQRRPKRNKGDSRRTRKRYHKRSGAKGAEGLNNDARGASENYSQRISLEHRCDARERRRGRKRGGRREGSSEEEAAVLPFLFSYSSPLPESLDRFFLFLFSR